MWKKWNTLFTVFNTYASPPSDARRPFKTFYVTLNIPLVSIQMGAFSEARPITEKKRSRDKNAKTWLYDGRDRARRKRKVGGSTQNRRRDIAAAGKSLFYRNGKTISFSVRSASPAQTFPAFCLCNNSRNKYFIYHEIIQQGSVVFFRWIFSLVA